MNIAHINSNEIESKFNKTTIIKKNPTVSQCINVKLLSSFYSSFQFPFGYLVVVLYFWNDVDSD